MIVYKGKGVEYHIAPKAEDHRLFILLGIDDLIFRKIMDVARSR